MRLFSIYLCSIIANNRHERGTLCRLRIGQCICGQFVLVSIGSIVCACRHCRTLSPFWCCALAFAWHCPNWPYLCICPLLMWPLCLQRANWERTIAASALIVFFVYSIYVALLSATKCAPDCLSSSDALFTLVWPFLVRDSVTCHCQWPTMPAHKCTIY